MTSKRIIIVGNARLNLALERWCKRFRDEVVRIDIEHDEWEEQLLSYAGSYDMLFETVSGSTELKKRVVQALDRHMTSKSVRMSSFLSHTITEIASWSQNAKSWLGFHPLHFDRLECLELSVPMQADSPLLEHLQALFAEREKRLVRIRDIVGGVFPRTLALIVNEAVYALQEGVATVQDIDTAMKKGTNYPRGPFEWADQIGLDHILFILQGLHREYGDDRYRPAPDLLNKVRAGQIGVSSGEGFYQYEQTD